MTSGGTVTELGEMPPKHLRLFPDYPSREQAGEKYNEATATACSPGMNTAYADWWQRAARMALEYAQHKVGCTSVQYTVPGNRCTCGLVEIIKQIGASHE